MLITSSTAYAHASVVIDPEGDISASTPPHYDILKAKVHATGDETEDHKSIVFSMKLAAPIPALDSTTFYGANWLLDTVSTRVGPEYNVVVRWCTTVTQPAMPAGLGALGRGAQQLRGGWDPDVHLDLRGGRRHRDPLTGSRTDWFAARVRLDGRDAESWRAADPRG